MDTLVDFLSRLGLALLYLWLYLTADHIQKLLQMLCQMLMTVMLPGNKVFCEICQDKLLWSDTIKLFVFFSSSQILLSPALQPLRSQGKYAKRKSRFKRSDGSTSSDTTSNSFVRQVTFHT